MDQKTCDWMKQRTAEYEELKKSKESLEGVLNDAKAEGAKISAIDFKDGDYFSMPPEISEKLIGHLVEVLEERITEIEKEMGEI